MDILKKAYPYYRKIYGILILCIVFGLARGVVELIEPQVVALIVDDVINPALGYNAQADSSIFNFLVKDIPKENLWEKMGVLVAVFLLFMLLFFVISYVRWNIAHYFSLKCDNAVRLDVLRKINSFGQPLLKEYSSGDLITIVNSDAWNVRDFHIATVPFLIDSLFYIGVASYMLSRIHIGLMAAPFLTLAVFLLVTKGFIKLCGEKFGILWEKSSELNTEAQESIYGIRTIQSYAREDVRKKQFNDRSRDKRDFATGFLHSVSGIFWRWMLWNVS